jgi:hypothetical protein
MTRTFFLPSEVIAIDPIFNLDRPPTKPGCHVGKGQRQNGAEKDYFH